MISNVQTACAALVRISGSRNFGDEQRIAIRMFSVTLARAKSTAEMSEEYRLLNPLLSQIGLLNETERAAIRRFRQAWTAARPSKAA